MNETSFSEVFEVIWFLITCAKMERQECTRDPPSLAQPERAKHNSPRIPAFKSTVKARDAPYVRSYIQYISFKINIPSLKTSAFYLCVHLSILSHCSIS